MISLLCFLAFFAVRTDLTTAATSNPMNLKLEYDFSWDDYKQRFGKQFSSCNDESQKSANFLTLVSKIKAHNIAASKGLHNYSMGVNAYSYLPYQEIVDTMNGFKVDKSMRRSGLPFPDFGDRALPASVDWRNKGAVTAVKDQGQCGSCWTFSSTGALEGQNYKATGKLVSLSEQNLCDCVYNRDGCQGGWMDVAFQWVANNSGIDTEASYPYQAVMGSQCLFSKSNVGGTDKGYVDVTGGSESALQQAVANIGPISVAIDASHPSFGSYSSGIYYEPSCSSTAIDHAVLVVGYGSEKGQDYWIVKNSWGTTWGEQGYIRMSRNHNNHCGIASYASYPTVSASGTSCKTTSGSDCVIPFIYKGVTYNGCTTVDDTNNWCSTKNDAKGNQMKAYWDYCASTCQSASSTG